MGKKSSKVENKPPKEFMPYIMGGADRLNDAYEGNMGQIQGATNQIVGLLPSMIDKYKAGDAGVNAARDYNVDVLSGKYLDQGNPYLDQVINRSINDSTNASQAALGLKGLTGGSSYADIISKNAGNIALDARYSDYNNERGRMSTAAGQSPGIAAAGEIPVQSMLGALQASQMPMNAASQYAGGLGGLLGGYGTQKQPGGWMNDILGAGSQIGAAAIMASERRVKRDIQQIGALPDGLGIYNYNYAWDASDEPVRTGVMVDEVEALRPWALGPVVDGIQTVDYAKLEAAR